MNVHESVYSVSTTCRDLSTEELVIKGANHSGCLERELAKRLAHAIDALCEAQLALNNAPGDAENIRVMGIVRAAIAKVQS